MTIVSCVDVVYLFLPKLLNSHVLLFFFFFFNDTATTEIYTLSLHGRSSDLGRRFSEARDRNRGLAAPGLIPLHIRVSDRKSTRLNSSHANISYAVFCLKK